MPTGNDLITGLLRKVKGRLACRKTGLSFGDLWHCANARQNQGREAPSDAQYGSSMSWWTYVTRTAGTSSPKELDIATGIDAPNFSKWKAGQIPKAETVAKFARAYGVPVLEAFVAAGFLTAAEAKVRPAPAPDYSQLTNDELLELVRARMEKGGGERGDRSAATSGPDSGPGLAVVPDDVAAHEEEHDIEDEQGHPEFP